MQDGKGVQKVGVPVVRDLQDNRGVQKVVRDSQLLTVLARPPCAFDKQSVFA